MVWKCFSVKSFHCVVINRCGRAECFISCPFLFLLGMFWFRFQTSSKTISKLANPNAPLGYGLCFLNLAFDGFTNATQDSINARYVKKQLSFIFGLKKQ